MASTKRWKISCPPRDPIGDQRRLSQRAAGYSGDLCRSWPATKACGTDDHGYRKAHSGPQARSPSATRPDACGRPLRAHRGWQYLHHCRNPPRHHRSPRLRPGGGSCPRGVREEARVGQRTTLDVLNAQQTLVNTRVALVTAQRDRVGVVYPSRRRGQHLAAGAESSDRGLQCYGTLSTGARCLGGVRIPDVR
jgi:hypothetical protein